MQQKHQRYYKHTATTHEMIGGTVPKHIHAREDKRDRLQHRKPPGPELIVEQPFHGCFVRLDLLPGKMHVSKICKNS